MQTPLLYWNTDTGIVSMQPFSRTPGQVSSVRGDQPFSLVLVQGTPPTAVLLGTGENVGIVIRNPANLKAGCLAGPTLLTRGANASAGYTGTTSTDTTLTRTLMHVDANDSGAELTTFPAEAVFYHVPAAGGDAIESLPFAWTVLPDYYRPGQLPATSPEDYPPAQKVVALDDEDKLPAVDGSRLTKLPITPNILTAGLIERYDFTEVGGAQVFNKVGPGARPANLLAFPEGPFAGGTCWSAGSATITDNYFINPSGGQNAARWQAVSGASLDALYPSRPTLVAGTTYTAFICLHNNTGAAQAMRTFHNDTFSSDFAVPAAATNGWAIVSQTWVQQAGATSQVLYLVTNAAGTPQDLSIAYVGLVAGSTVPKFISGARTLGLRGTPSITTAGLNLAGGFNFAAGGSPGELYAEATIYMALTWPLASAPIIPFNVGLLSDPGSLYLCARNGAQPGPTFGFGGSSLFATLANLQTGAPLLVDAVYRGGTYSLCINGDEVATMISAQAPIVSQATILGQLGVGDNQFSFPGTIHEEIRYNVGHSSADRATMRKVVAADVQAKHGITLPVSSPQFVQFDGDSISALQTVDGSTSYTVGTMVTLQSSYPGIQGCNVAVPGSSIGTSADGPSTAGYSMFGRLPVTSAKWRPGCDYVLVCGSGHNDIGVIGFPLTQYVANLTSYCAAQRAAATAAGATLKIVWLSILPSTSVYSDGTYANFNAKKTAANILLRSLVGTVIDGLADFDTNSALSANSAPGSAGSTSPSTYYADGTHPKQAGNDAMTPIVATAVSAALAA